MGKILTFTRPGKPEAAITLTPKQAIDRIVTAMVIEIVPTWIEREWPFVSLEILANQLREGMLAKSPEGNIDPQNVEAIIEELKPLWKEIANIAAESY